MGYPLEEVIGSWAPESNLRSVLMTAVLGPTLVASNSESVTSAARDARRNSAEKYLKSLKPPETNEGDAWATVVPHDSSGAQETLLKDWHVVPHDHNAPDIFELFDHPLFKNNYEARVFCAGRPMQQNNSPGLSWLWSMGLRSKKIASLWRIVMMDVAAGHQRSDVRYAELSGAFDRLSGWGDWRSSTVLSKAKPKIAIAIISAMLKMLEQPADDADLEYCDYLHHSRNTTVANETTRTWQRVPVKLPTSIRREAEADCPGITGFIRRSDVQE